jgi:uncharacterized protein (DUF433 family)
MGKPDSIDRKRRRLQMEKAEKKCSRCPPHDGENRGRRTRPDRYKSRRRMGEGNLTMDWRKIITIEPGKRSGQPCVRGLRMTVYDVLEYLAGGMTHAEILEDFPNLTEEDIRACLAFAADMGKSVSVLHTVSPPPAGQ